MSSLSLCPSCNRQIRISSKFCKYCGITLKTCPECNEINTVEDKFCGSCGEDISKVEAPEPSKEIRLEEKEGPRIEEIQEVGESQPKLVVWPPLPYAQQHTQQRPSPLVAEEQPLYDPSSLKHPYSKVKFFGYLRGTFPSTSVLSATIEVFGLALALIAVGIAIIGIGFAFFEYIIPAIIGGIFGGALLISAPFFGIYFVSSNWLYKAFRIKKPISNRTILWNYSLSALLFSFLAAVFGLLLSPVFLEGIGPIGITFLALGGIVVMMGLIIVPLKAFLADLVYVKAAANFREKEEEEEEEDQKIETTEEKKDVKTTKKQTKKKKK